jgi:hypothetical protein
MPLGSAMVAAVVGLYHGRLLVADLRRLPRKTEATPDVGWPQPQSTAADAPHADTQTGTQARTLILLVPAGVSADEVVGAMRAQLPLGATLEDDAGA